MALVVMWALLACSPSTPINAPTPTTTAPTDTAPATAPATGSPESDTAPPTTPPTGATMPATDCLVGPYRLLRFVQLGGKQAYGTGQGGDVDVTFTGKSYLLRGSGTDPIVLTLAGQTADLTIDGTAKGTFDLEGDRATFTLGDAKGSATLKTGSERQRLTMDEVAAAVAPDGSAQVACTTVAMTLTFSDLRLELGRYLR
jgi:hypothetical protein